MAVRWQPRNERFDAWQELIQFPGRGYYIRWSHGAYHHLPAVAQTQSYRQQQSARDGQDAAFGDTMPQCTRLP